MRKLGKKIKVIVRKKKIKVLMLSVGYKFVLSIFVVSIKRLILLFDIY